MRNIYYSWRFYTLGREQYSENLNKLFSNNLQSLYRANIIVIILAVCFSLIPLVLHHEFLKIGLCIAVALIALLLAIVSNYSLQKINIDNRYVYVLTTLFFTNIVLFGTYISVWSYPDILSPVFYCFLICMLLFFVSSPLYNAIVTLGAVTVFIASSFIVNKGNIDLFFFDIICVLIAGMIGLFFSWQMTRLRLGVEFSTSQLEEERNKYLNQSIVDELTQLRNKRDYMQTFQRFVHNFRASDDWFCVAIGDIDFFKNYNDHYGHPKGDDCLRSIGGALNGLKENLGVYAARVGGEEFSLLWFEKDASHVDTVIKTMISAIKEQTIPHEKSKVAEFVTMSIGVYVVRCSQSNDVQTLYDLADKALYTAKASGRNCAIVYGEEIKQYKILPPDSE
jgi:diguanylate cyclase (GGDEF)-like protein